MAHRLSIQSWAVDPNTKTSCAKPACVRGQTRNSGSQGKDDVKEEPRDQERSR